eukprot:snap_masked-scaffold_48-processed-gene-1.117-mRNA-1 protein AED:1.00 eAED:1.00 QI:0/-1/0/0/-1/1/1/0/93
MQDLFKEKVKVQYYSKQTGWGLNIYISKNQVQNLFFKKTSSRNYISRKNVQDLYFKKQGLGFTVQEKVQEFIFQKKWRGFGFKDLCSRFQIYI